jgi:phage head maturation protease
LVAELRIAQTPLGDETLALADEDCLDASAGFAPMSGGETWPERDWRRVTKAFLGHIAMTPDPAYSGAGVLAVRGAASSQSEPPATPHLDEVRAWTLTERYARAVR